LIRNPAAVGAGIFWLVAASFLASMLWVIRDLAGWLDRIDPTAGSRFSQWTPPQTKLIASVLVLIALSAVWRLSPPHKAVEAGVVRRDIRLLGIGLCFAGLAMLELTFAGLLEVRLTDQWAALYRPAITLSLVFFMFIAMIGLQGVLRVIGRRSRQYRTARGSLQNVHALMAVLVFIGLGILLEHAPTAWSDGGMWSNLGRTVTAISYVMLVVGLGYLFVNTLWIRRALRQQPPTLDELLLPRLPKDAHLPDLDPDAEQLDRATEAQQRARPAAAEGSANGSSRRVSGTADGLE
jgi:predicted small integral membrane protein